MPKQIDALGDRMKKYEYITRNHLVSRMPVVLRIDGKAFHSFTKGFYRPFDDILIRAMQETMKYLCENIQGCVLGYVQSDEITLVLVDYKKLDSCAWFDNNIQKMCSVSASMATVAFNMIFAKLVDDFYKENTDFVEADTGGYRMEFADDNKKRVYEAYKKAMQKGAMFDSRAFNVPKEEVTNCVLWRQNDATRNSIEMAGQANFSHKNLQNKSCVQIQDMLMLEKGINWNNFETHKKRGSCCVKVFQEGGKRSKWIIDKEIPIFKGEGRKYIDDLIFVGE